jgi:hypothetical protein
MRHHQPTDDTAIRGTECMYEVDEFTAAAKGWRYWSDGTSLLPYCPACARREFADDAPASGRVPLIHRAAIETRESNEATSF